jgi:VanZ family protein
MLRMFSRTGSLLALLCIVYATLVPIWLRPKTGHPHLEHVLAFALLGVTAAVAFPRRPWSVLVGLAFLAFGLEYLQTFIPTRDGRMFDAMEKLVGAGAGATFGLVVNRLGPQPPSPAPL